MFLGFSRGSAAVVLCAFGASAAQADVSAQDVWSDWRAYLLGTGYELSGTEQMSGGTLTVSDTELALTMPEDDVAISMQLGTLTFAENGDGTVSISLPGSMPISISGLDEDGAEFQADLAYTQTGFSMVAGGDPDAMTYNYTAASLGLSLAGVTVDGVALGDDFAQMAISLANVIGSTQVAGGDLREYAQTMQAGGMSVDVAINDPDEGLDMALTGRTDGIELQSVTSLPAEVDTENMAAMIEAGFSADGTLAFGPGSSNFAFQDAEENLSYESSSDGGAFGFLIGDDGFGYSVEQGNVSVNLAGSEMPIPVSVSFAELIFDMMVPVMEAAEPQDFALTISLGDFTVSDLLWGILDPTGQLPRDPATIVLDLVGQARLLANVMDPVVAAQLESGPPPAELEALTIEDLEITAAGASLTGTGDFTFDNSDVTTFDGVPRPTGALDLQLVGANGLLDKLVAMGLLPEDQAGGARMMMGLFAVPGDGPDTLNSRLEINEQGHILANGQRIQ